MKTLITARLSSTEGEWLTSLIKTQVAIGTRCIMDHSVIGSYEYLKNKNALSLTQRKQRKELVTG